MTAISLSVDGLEVEDVSVTETGGNITVGGTAIIDVEKTGIIPVTTATVQVDTLEVTGVEAAEDETESISSAGEVEIDFSFTQSSSQYSGTAQSLCSGGQLDAEVEGKLSGFIVSNPFDESFRSSVSPTCSLQSGSQQPGSGDGNGGNNGGGFGPAPGPGGGSGGGDGGQQTDTFDIVNQSAESYAGDDPYVNTDQTYVARRQGSKVSSYPRDTFNWEWQFGNEKTKSTEDGVFTGIRGDPSQVDYNWDNTGTYTITVTVTRMSDQRVVAQSTLQETVVEQDDGLFGAGNGSVVDEGSIGGTTTPSMDEAAKDKRDDDRGF